jgi:ferredoxin
VLRDRAKDDSQGLFGFLRTVNKKWTVTYDENDETAHYVMNNIQDLAWGAADDRTRNWREIDARRIEGPIPVECRSASCGTCWVGVLGGADKLSDVAAREGKKIKEFGYIDTNEPKPLIRLACQAQTHGAVSIVIPPWNGVFGKYLRGQKAAASPRSIPIRYSHQQSKPPTITTTELTPSQKFSPLLYVLAAALLWSTGGLFIKWTKLSGLELSFYRSFFAVLTVAFFTRRKALDSTESLLLRLFSTQHC